MYQQNVCICCLTDRDGDTAMSQPSPLQSLSTHCQTLGDLNLTRRTEKKRENPKKNIDKCVFVLLVFPPRNGKITYATYSYL